MVLSLTAGSVEFKPCTKLAKMGMKKKVIHTRVSVILVGPGAQLCTGDQDGLCKGKHLQTQLHFTSKSCLQLLCYKASEV